MSSELTNRLIRKYPRFCSNVTDVKIKVDLEQKSDLWMIKFIEDCYNDAFSACFKEVSRSRRRKRCGLELGSLDAFPLVAQRFLSRQYSVLEVRYKLCLEILATIESKVRLGSPVDIDTKDDHELRGSKKESTEDIINMCLRENNNVMCINSERALIFSRFLSEEWDLDYLAIFLHHRDILQRTLDINLRELVVSRVMGNVIQSPEKPHELVPYSTSLDTSTFIPNEHVSSDYGGFIGGEVVPSSAVVKVKQNPITISVPSCVKFVPDFTFPESALASVDIDRLGYICQELFPTSTTAQKTYLIEKILYRISAMKKESSRRVSPPPTLDTALNRSLDATVDDSEDKPTGSPTTKETAEKLGKRQITASKEQGSISVDGTLVIPLYVILLVLMEEWKLIPLEAKAGLSEVGRASEDSLKELNELYQNNCELMAKLQHTGKTLDAENLVCQSRLIKEEKVCRRLERRWNDNVATADELIKLQELRVTITEIKTEKQTIEANMKINKQEQTRLASKIETLWSTALASGLEDNESGKKVSKKKKKSSQLSNSESAMVSVKTVSFDKNKWRNDVQELIIKALSRNNENADTRAQAKQETHATTGGGSIVTTDLSGTALSLLAKKKRTKREIESMEKLKQMSKLSAAAKKAASEPPAPVKRKISPKKTRKPKKETEVDLDEGKTPTSMLPETTEKGDESNEAPPIPHVITTPAIPEIPPPLLEDAIGAGLMTESLACERKARLVELEVIASDLALVGYSEAKALGLVPTKDVEDAKIAEEKRIKGEIEEMRRKKMEELELERGKRQHLAHELAMRVTQLVRDIVSRVASAMLPEVIQTNVMKGAECIIRDMLQLHPNITLYPGLSIAPTMSPCFAALDIDLVEQQCTLFNTNLPVDEKEARLTLFGNYVMEIQQTACHDIYSCFNNCIVSLSRDIIQKLYDEVANFGDIQQVKSLPTDSSESTDAVMLVETPTKAPMEISEVMILSKFKSFIEQNIVNMLNKGVNIAVSNICSVIGEREYELFKSKVSELSIIQRKTIDNLKNDISIVANDYISLADTKLLRLIENKRVELENARIQEENRRIDREIFGIMYETISEIERKDMLQKKYEEDVETLSIKVVDEVTSKILNGDGIGNHSSLIESILWERNHKAIIALYEILHPRDPWECLDENPETFLDESVLSQVEEYFMIQQMQQIGYLKKHCLLLWKRYLAIRQNSKKFYMFQLKKRFYSRLLKNHLWFKLRNKMSKRIQMLFIHYIRDRKTRRLNAEFIRSTISKADDFYKNKLLIKRRNIALKYLVYRMRTQKKSGIVIYNLTDRRFIKTFYTWLMLYKNHKKEREEREEKCNRAALSIQCIVRCKLSRQCLLRKNIQLKLILAMKCALARHEVQRRKQKMELLGEYSLAVVTRQQRRLQRMGWNRYRRNYCFKTGLAIFRMWYNKKKEKTRFRTWKRQCDNLGTVRQKKASIIQSAVRMYIVQKYVLNYFSWRRNLKKIQALFRGRIARGYFYSVLPLYRAAIQIQRSFRGHVERSQLTQQRIRAIHYSSANNNYEKLLYYVKKYPELLYEVDEEGNTAIHSAAKNACRRTLKLLMKQTPDLANSLNFAGYSPFHLTVMSNAINRDDLALYMLEIGFDEEQDTPDGKTCLLLACDYGRVTIVRTLLEAGIDCNIPDHYGTTCLQTAASQGFYGIVKLLLESGADVNSTGYNGTTPLHDCVASSDVRIAELLITHGAYVKVYEPNYNQSPLMYACRHGDADIARLYILWGADVSEADANGYTSAHHSTISNNIELYHALREADADFDGLDINGDSCLHIAVQFNSIEYVKALLEGGAFPSHQNNDGNQPIHLAAQYDHVECLEVLCRYDEHVGRVNNSHQTPLGIAKFNSSMRAIEFLERRYVRLERPDERNEHGDLWWDKDVDTGILSGWKVEVSDRGDRIYVNTETGEVRDTPPVCSVTDVEKAVEGNEWRLKKSVVVVPGDEKVTKHEYDIEYKEFAAEVKKERHIYETATFILKFVRGKLARNELKRLRKQAQRKLLFTCFFIRYYPNFKRNITKRHGVFCRRIQALFRGYRLRNRFREFIYDMRLYDYNCRKLARLIFKFWRYYKCNYQVRMRKYIATAPQTITEWIEVIREAGKPLRCVGMFEVYKYKQNVDIFFYRHKVSGACTLIKPKKLALIDDQDYIDTCQMKARGYTTKQYNLAVTLQKLWRGYKCRYYYIYVESAMKISMTAEIDYLTDPASDKNLYNYTLHCHVVLRDYDKARRLYMECLNRMAFRGPDFAFILYAYAIFAFVTHDLDYIDVITLLTRARKAEEVRETLLRKKNNELESLSIANGTFRHGKVFELAKLGFFRYVANSASNGPAWHNYAACCFLVYDDYNASFEAFLNGFRYDASNVKMKKNFDIMMSHFWGTDPEVLSDKVRSRMRYLADKDDELQNIRTRKFEQARERSMAATQIQKWFRCIEANRGFRRFMDNLRIHVPIPPSAVTRQQKR